MKFFDQFKKSKGSVGLEVTTSGFSVVAREVDGKLTSITMVEADPEVNRAEQLKELVVKLGLERKSCFVVLPTTAYQMLLVEAPEVAEDELREAIKWKIKDLLTADIEDSVIDLFHLPQDGNRSGKKMVYVVASSLGEIRGVIDWVTEAGLILKSIETEEMALRNVSLVKSEAEESRGVAIVRVSEGGGSVSLYKAGNLYLSRQFSLDYSGGLLDDLPVESLALEVQRSLDYYERQMGLAPPSALMVCGENITEDKISTELKRSINVPVEFLNIAEQLEINAEEFDEGILQVCIGALGSVYRERLVI